MFESRDYPKSLEESTFELWLQKGRDSKISYTLLLVLWDEGEQEYLPKYAESKDEIQSYEKYELSYGRQSLVAAYDLYSEGKIA